jgi:hypothetical protein
MSNIAGRFIRWLFEMGEPEASDSHIRGARLDTIKEVMARYDKERAPDDAGIPFGFCRIPTQSSTKGFLLVGAQGTGKTTFINILLKYGVFSRIGDELDRMKEWQGLFRRPLTRAYIFDAKNTFYHQLEELGLPSEATLHHVHPFARSGKAWDIAADITTDTEAESIAKLLFPKRAGGNEFFDVAEQQLLHAVLVSFTERARARNIRWTLRDVILALVDEDDLFEILKWAPDAAVNMAAHRYLPIAEPRLRANVIAGITSKSIDHTTVAARWDHQARQGRTFSIKNWKAQNSVIVFGHSHRCEVAMGAIHRTIFKRISQEILDQRNDPHRRTWVILDELPTVLPLDGLEALFSKGREKGASIVLGFQEIPQLEDAIAGQRSDAAKASAAALLGHCGFVGVFHVDSSDTAEWAEKKFGMQQFRRASSTFGLSPQGPTSSQTINVVDDPIVKAAQFRGLGFPNVNLDRGPEAFFTGPAGAYALTTKMEDIMKLTPKPVEEDLEEETTEDGTNLDRLKPWTEKERRALGLPPRGEGEQPDDEEFRFFIPRE